MKKSNVRNRQQYQQSEDEFTSDKMNFMGQSDKDFKMIILVPNLKSSNLGKEIILDLLWWQNLISPNQLSLGGKM